MTTETDDLNYYEHNLPKVIAGVLRGEKWEYKMGDHWILAADSAFEYLAHHLDLGYRVRLAPVPVVRPWSEPADVPPLCWIRDKGHPETVCMIVGMGPYRVSVSQKGEYAWSKFDEFEYSTDLKSWHPCVKPEGGK